MRVNNISEQRSLRNFIFLFLVFIMVTSALVYLFSCVRITNFRDLFKDFVLLFDFFGNAFLNCILPILILGFYISFIYLGILKIKRWFEFYNSLNVKYIDLLPDRIDFVYTDSKYNFSCAYKDIQNLNVDFFIELKSARGGIYVFPREMSLWFTLYDNKVINISNTTYFPFGLMCKILDYTKGVQSFTFNLLRKSGAFAEEFDKSDYKYFSELRDFKSRIENYRKFGKTTLLSKEVENSLTMLAIFMFVGPIVGYGIFIPYSSFNSYFMSAAPFLLFFVFLTVVFDIILIKNEERKPIIEHKKSESAKSNGELSSIEPKVVSIYDIIKIQVVVLILFICTVFYFYWQDIVGFLF